MAQNSSKTLVITFDNMIAMRFVPVSDINRVAVTTPLPKVTDMTVPFNALSAYVTAGDNALITKKIVLQDGSTFSINISQAATSEIHYTLLRGFEKLSIGQDDNSGTISGEQFYFSYSAVENETTNGSESTETSNNVVSILNGILSVSW